MPVSDTFDEEGNRILEESGFKEFKDVLLNSVAEYIRDNPDPGQDIQSIIDKVVDNRDFEEYYIDLLERTKSRTSLDGNEAEKGAKILLGEMATTGILNGAPGLLDVTQNSSVPQELEEVHEDLVKERVLKKEHVSKAVRTRSYHLDIFNFLRRHLLMIQIIGLGGVMIILSAILLSSVYDALVAALTLNAVPTESITGKVGNILGAFGGVILFFTTVSLAISHVMERNRERERISRLAEGFLKESG
ncbi:MAG: hypothetical protein ACOCZP_02235 [Candidatus Hadarchaeota archaeon]